MTGLLFSFFPPKRKQSKQQEHSLLPELKRRHSRVQGRVSGISPFVVLVIGAAYSSGDSRRQLTIPRFRVIKKGPEQLVNTHSRVAPIQF